MAVEIEVTTAPPIMVQVTENKTSVEVTSAPDIQVVVGNGVQQQNLWVTETDPGMSGPGIWVQTNIDGVADDFTIWIEDGI
jgi:hypothetical protein